VILRSTWRSTIVTSERDGNIAAAKRQRRIFITERHGIDLTLANERRRAISSVPLLLRRISAAALYSRTLLAEDRGQPGLQATQVQIDGVNIMDDINCEEMYAYARPTRARY